MSEELKQTEAPTPRPAEEASPELTLHEQHEISTLAEHSVVEKLGTISVSEIMEENHIDPEAAAYMARNKIGLAYATAQKYGSFAPDLANEIAHRLDAEHPVRYPSAAEIKQRYWGARVVSGTLRLFSSRLAARFDKYIEKKARHKIVRAGQAVGKIMDILSSAPQPKEQFINEIAEMHSAISNSDDPYAEMQQTLRRMSNLEEFSTSQVTEEERERAYPLLDSLTRLPGVRVRLSDRKRSVQAFAPEVIQGIEQFLQKHGLNVNPASINKQPTLKRKLAQIVMPKTTSLIADKVERMLTNTYGLLPENSTHFRINLYRLCRQLVERSKQGESGRQLAINLVREVNRLVQ